MGISDLIASFISEALEAADGNAELQRAELAARFNCVPSQINYVISTRFSPERGYVVESRRGGGGYIRIRRVQIEPDRLIMHSVNSIGDSIDFRVCEAYIVNLMQAGVISTDAAKVMRAAVSEAALRPVPTDRRDEVRAAIFKQMLVNTL